MPYTPPQIILDRYADLLVNFALNSGKGIKRGEVVLLQVSEYAKPMYLALRRACLKSGGTFVSQYLPDGVAREYYELASPRQLTTFHAKYMRGLVDEADHSIFIISETDMHELEGVDPERIMMRSRAHKPYVEWRDHKEYAGNFTWTLALYGTEAMAAEAHMGIEEYWEQIIHACFLKYRDPITHWREVFRALERWRNKLDALPIESLHIEGYNIDLTIGLGPGRVWVGGSGRNIPSFELFTTPDWRKTEGTIAFNQPLYRYGSFIEGVHLKFKRGEIVKATAEKNAKLLTSMIATDAGARRLGEFSLTHRQLSRIAKFMADTLYDENRGGEWGNMHMAVGRAYKDTYPGNPARVSKDTWRRLGYNDSVVHTDMISTTKRTVTATLKGGTKKIIYKDGDFTL